MRPTARGALIMAAGFPVALVPVLISPQLWTLWLAFVGAALSLMAIDAVLALPRRRVAITATPPEILYIGDSDNLVIEIKPRGWRRAVRMEVLCDLDEDLEVQPIKLIQIPSQTVGKAKVRLVPKRRGHVRVERV